MLNQNVIDAVIPSAVNLVNEVEEGSVVKAVFIERWIQSDGVETTRTQFNLTIEKVPAGQAPMTQVQSLNAGSYPNKKNILYMSQGILGGEGTQGAVPIIRNWFKIPKGKQRFGLGDRLFVNIAMLGQQAEACGFATYKEYT